MGFHQIIIERVEDVEQQYGVDSNNKPLPIPPLITQQTTQEWQPTAHYKAASDCYAKHCLENKDDVYNYDPLIFGYTTLAHNLPVHYAASGVNYPTPQRVMFKKIDITGGDY